MMIKKISIISLLALGSVSAAGNGWDIEAGYEYQIFNDPDVEFSAFGFGGGYRWDFDSDTSGTLEALGTFGISDDNLGPAIIDINGTISLGYRITQQLDNDWSLYGRVVYTDVGTDVSISFLDVEERASGNGIGVGGGVSWRGVQAGYTLYTGDLEDFSAINIGYRWRL